MLVCAVAAKPIATCAQIANWHQKKIVVNNDTLLIDTLRIMPNTVIVKSGGTILKSTQYEVNELKNLLILKDSTIRDTLEISYRTLPSFLSKTYFHKDTTFISNQDKDTFKPYVVGKASQNILDDTGLQKNGSLSRGILFGNNQNLAVNSSLNLQLSGKLTERYNLLASVTDDNIPVQPQGNTQQLQDFDQVFIQIYDDKTKLIAGDFILKKPQGYFLNYFKRAQGAYVNTRVNNVAGGSVMNIEASASVSKGRFGRNVIQGIEGNQGPYRLKGTDGELFIIILAGTEQVYIDGKLLQRGQDKDYVIDYNAAEIVFTPRQFITKDRRINVEFQYSEKRYARPLLQTSITAEKNKNKFYLNVYSENDAKNQPLQQELSQNDKAILAAAGDNLLNAYKSGIDSVEYVNKLVLYALADSLGFDSVYVYSTDSLQAHYRLTFTQVGNGYGDYVEDGFTANGRKFKWVQPILQGTQYVKQGNYSPIVLLATPKKTQMITAGTEWIMPSKKKLVKNTLIAEGALSNKDLNTFSTLDSKDDVGFAFRTKYNYERKGLVDIADTTQHYDGIKKSTFYINTGYEYTAKNFAPIERFREVEFARNWNVLNINIANDQHIGSSEIIWKKKNLGLINFGADALLIGNNYQGYKGKLNTNILTKNKFKAIISASYLTTQGQIKTQFLRHKTDISKQWEHVRLYFKDEHEHNLFYKNNTDSLASNTYQFYDWEVGAGTADTASKSITIYYRDRIDRKAQILSLAGAARAEQYGLLMTLRGKKDSRLSVNVSNRKLRAINPELFTQSPENTLLTRVEYNFKWKEGFVQSTTFYEVGSGLEQKRQFIYLEVPAGQGAFVWIDYNEDGVKDLNEFEVAQFSYEANYIRSSVQTNDYVRTYTNQFSQSFNITPAKILKKKTKLNLFVNRWNSQTSFRADRKTTRENKDERFNPFLTTVADSSLLSLNGMFRNILFFNKSNPTFGLDYTYQNARNKTLLSNGFESRGDYFHQLGVRWNFMQDITFFIESRTGIKTASSDFLSGRNYEINYYSLQPKLTWQPNKNSRFNLLAQYTNKDNRTGTELTTIEKIGIDATINSTEKGSLIAEVNYLKINYNGAANNSLSFEMLEGLNRGNNFTWSATLQRTVAKNLQLNLIYNGRKPESIKTIHSGGVQLRAFF